VVLKSSPLVDELSDLHVSDLLRNDRDERLKVWPKIRPKVKLSYEIMDMMSRNPEYER
jgi:hypothetical protein